MELANDKVVKLGVSVNEQLERAKRNNAKCIDTLAQHTELFNWLTDQDHISVSPDLSYINIRFAGKKDDLLTVWKRLRAEGWATDERPAPRATSHMCFWNKADYSTLFMSFSSTQCERVVVGEETFTRPVYETRCAGNELDSADFLEPAAERGADSVAGAVS